MRIRTSGQLPDTIPDFDWKAFKVELVGIIDAAIEKGAEVRASKPHTITEWLAILKHHDIEMTERNFHRKRSKGDYKELPGSTSTAIILDLDSIHPGFEE